MCSCSPADNVEKFPLDCEEQEELILVTANAEIVPIFEDDDEEAAESNELLGSHSLVPEVPAGLTPR